MRYATIIERIDQRIEHDNLPAAHRLLKYIDRSDPGNTQVNERMVATAEVVQDWIAQQKALSALIFAASRDDDIEDLVFRFVKLLTEKMNQPEEAVSMIRDHFKSFIKHPGSVAWAREHLVEGPHRQTLINIAQSHIVHPLDSYQNIPIYNALGTWYATKPGDYKCACKWYRIVLRLRPGDTDAIDGLIALLQ